MIRNTIYGLVYKLVTSLVKNQGEILVKRNHWLDVAGCGELLVGQYVVPNFVSNSIALDVGEGCWVLYSPGESLLKSWNERFGDAVSEISIIIPNHYHYLGVDAWLQAYPSAKVYASDKAIPRLIEKGIPSVLSLESSPPVLPLGYQVQIPEGHRGGDVWLCKTGERNVWITCDSFLNYERLSNQLVARAMQRLLGAAPGLKMSDVVKWLILDDRPGFKRWALKQLAVCSPEILIPSHGEVLHAAQLRDQIEALLEARL